MNNRKRILFLSATSFANAYAGTSYLINALTFFGFDVDIIVFCESEEVDYYKDNYKNIRLFTKKFSKSKLHKLNTFFRLLLILYKSMGYENVLIIEGHFLPLSKYIKILKPSTKITQFCQELWFTKDHPWSKQARIFEKLSNIPDIVVDVEINRALIRRELFKLNHTPFVLINTIPEKVLPEKMPYGALSRLVGVVFPKEIPIIIYTGGVGPEKPFDRLVQILKQVKREHFFLAIINASKMEVEKYQKVAQELLKQNTFKICSSLSRIKILESTWEADIGLIDYSYSIQPTYNQKFCAPTKLFEYMASGLAIVGSNNISLRSVIEQNKIGYCAKDDSELSFAEGIDNLLSDYKRLKAMKRRSYELFRTKYSYELINYPVVNQILQKMN